MSKDLDETVRLQSEKRREWIREIRGERLQGVAEGASSAPCLASSSVSSFPERNECPGTYCSMIEQEKREDSSCRSATEFEIKEKWRRGQGGEDRMKSVRWCSGESIRFAVGRLGFIP